MNPLLTTTPPSAPMAMPTQILSRLPERRFAALGPVPMMGRLLTFGGALLLTLLAAWQMHETLPLHATTAAPGWVGVSLWLVLTLFIITFGWVALTAMAAVAGAAFGEDQRKASPDAPLQGKTVLLMPVYNEDPVCACAALAAMAEELASLGLAGNFEIFILSDSNRPELLASEAATARALREQLADIMPVWYRRRERNTARKAGNIRDFVCQWGDRYDYMVVLDADSLIAGQTLGDLVREMDADPQAGIVQTLPQLYAGETLYARIQQFASLAYGSIFARGLNAWQGHDGNYWGHNAIIRVQAMAESAGLPNMPGPRPFGGEIRSHDFVEAALMRRAGWSVRMLPGLPGSWEECPPSLLDAAVRDRRWAQGNVQHLSVVTARGLRWPSRMHMLMGVLNYVTSPLWLLLIMMGLLLGIQLDWLPDSALSSANAQAGEELVFDAQRMTGLFIATMVLLLLPKLLGVLNGVFLAQQERGSSLIRFMTSAALELLVSILHAPIVMMMHSSHLWEIVRGKDSGWSTQQRRAQSVPWRELFRRHSGQTLLGLGLLALLIAQSSPLLLWMLPVIAGLLLAIPLSALSGSRRAAAFLAARGLLLTPEELSPPAIIQRREYYIDRLGAGQNSDP